MVSGQWSVVSDQGVFGGCGIWDATAGARHHPAFGHQPLRGRLTHLVMEAAGMLMASADGSFGFAQDDGTGGPRESDGMLWASAGYAPSAHSIPPYWAAPFGL